MKPKLRVLLRIILKFRLKFPAVVVVGILYVCSVDVPLFICVCAKIDSVHMQYLHGLQQTMTTSLNTSLISQITR